jgi:ribonuclease J
MEQENRHQRDPKHGVFNRNNPITTRVVRKIDNEEADKSQKVDPSPRRSTPYSPEAVFAEARTLEEKKSRVSAPRRNQNERNKGPSHKRFDRPPRPLVQKKEVEDTLPPAGDNIRIIPLGGVEEIGKNMTMIEYKDDIIVIDMGFAFKDENTPGIDYLLPNTKYLEDRKDKIRAVIITHGHLDHIGGIPYIMDRIGNPPLYTRNLTALMIKKRQTEFPNVSPIDYKVVEKSEELTIGKLKVKFFGVTHSIPDCLGVAIRTPFGNIVNPGDYKLDHMDEKISDVEEKIYNDLAKEQTLLLMTDSTNIENPGFSTPESIVVHNLGDIVKNTKGRLIMALFASHINRVIKVIEAAERCNKKVVIEGRSMKNNVEICKEAKLLEVKKDTIIQAQDIENYPPDRIVILSTGGQGEEFSALSRMAAKNYKYIQITNRDTIVLSASIVPGNERDVQKLKDNLARHGAKIIHYRTSDVYIHSTGHGNRGEIEWLHRKLKPKFFIPIHGNHYMLRLHGELAQNMGMPENHIIVPDNGSVIEIENGEKIKLLKEKAPSGAVMVDGFAIGDMQDVVIRDRQMLAQDGMFVIIASVNSTTGRLKKSPDIISRGFVYLRENQELLRQARLIIKKTIEDNAAGQRPINFEYIKNVVTDNVGRFLFQKTAKRPIVIPVILGV